MIKRRIIAHVITLRFKLEGPVEPRRFRRAKRSYDKKIVLQARNNT